MNLREFAELLGRYVWPFVIAWNVFLYQQQATNREYLYEFRLEVARNYTAKRDLEKMFADFGEYIDKRLDQLVRTINKE